MTSADDQSVWPQVESGNQKKCSHQNNKYTQQDYNHKNSWYNKIKICKQCQLNCKKLKGKYKNSATG